MLNDYEAAGDVAGHFNAHRCHGEGEPKSEWEVVSMRHTHPQSGRTIAREQLEEGIRKTQHSH